MSSTTGAKQMRPAAISRKRRLPDLWTIAWAVMLVVIAASAVFAPQVAPRGPTEVDLLSRMVPPGSIRVDDSRAWLGTDELGRDMLSRILYGARVSLLVGVVAVFGAGTLGVVLGLVSGYYGGRMDLIVMRIVDVQLAFPPILLALAIISVAGPSLPNLILTLAITRWVSYARVVRGVVLSLRKQEFVEAARAFGASDSRLLIRHIFPHVLTPVLTLATMEMGRVIIAEASLSFLGLGIQPPTPSWGGMISAGRNYLYSAWWTSAFPGLAIALAAMTVGFLGDAIRDRLDPRVRKLI